MSYRMRPPSASCLVRAGPRFPLRLAPGRTSCFAPGRTSCFAPGRTSCFASLQIAYFYKNRAIAADSVKIRNLAAQGVGKKPVDVDRSVRQHKEGRLPGRPGNQKKLIGHGAPATQRSPTTQVLCAIGPLLNHPDSPRSHSRVAPESLLDYSTDFSASSMSTVERRRSSTK